LGTTVKLSVVRQARAEPQAVELVRTRLRPMRVVSGRLEDDIGYVKIATFSEGKAAEVAEALKQLEGQGVNKLVIDLRDCAGGAAEEAVAVSRLLLERGLITYLQGQQYPKQQFSAEAREAIWKGPVTVLINQGTAGPAEIVAAAVLENNRGQVVGQRSYGVGSVQKLIPLEDGSALILSVAKYYSPGGKAIQDHAVTPSVPVELTEEAAQTSSIHAMPPPSDPVLLKALEVLRTQPVSAPARKAA
jgi:carboxyl-terminal processing protease